VVDSEAWEGAPATITSHDLQDKASPIQHGHQENWSSDFMTVPDAATKFMAASFV